MPRWERGTFAAQGAQAAILHNVGFAGSVSDQAMRRYRRVQNGTLCNVAAKAPRAHTTTRIRSATVLGTWGWGQ